MNNNRKFRGIWIPREIWLDKNLTIHEKVMLVEIDSLDNESGCFARNPHFCEFLGVNERRVQSIISSLRDKGLIDVELIREPGGKAIKGRVMRVSKKCCLFDGIDEQKRVVQETAPGGAEKCVKVVSKSAPGGVEKCAVSNTSIRNTGLDNINKSATPKKVVATPPLDDIFSPVLADKVRDWLEYKKERREGYKEIGLKSLITEIRHNAERYGEEAVADLINTCMAAGYRGIIFDKLKNQPMQNNAGGHTQPQTPKSTGNPFLDMLREEQAREAAGE